MATRRLYPFPETLNPLTGVRFFLAVGVVFFHYQLSWVYSSDLAGLFNRARLSVDIFFILSGFILTHVYLLGERPPPYRSFIVARFARIYPAHLVILLGMGTLFLGASLVGVAIDSHHFSITSFVRTLLLVQAWTPSDNLTNWNGPAWSLSAEWFAYLLFPAYAWIALKLRERPIVIMALATLAFIVIDYFYAHATGVILPRAEDNMGIFRIMPEFLFGIGLYYFGQTLNPSRNHAIIWALVASAALLGAMQIGLDDRVIVALAGPFILALALLPKAGVTTFLSAPFLLFWGEASFALYLVHMPVFMVWRNLMQKLFGLEPDYLMGLPELICLFALTLALAGGIHILVERPGRGIIRSLFLKPKADMPRPA